MPIVTKTMIAMKPTTMAVTTVMATATVMFVVLMVVTQWGTDLVDAEPITAVIMTGIMRLLQC